MKTLISVILIGATWIVQGQVVVTNNAKLSFFSEAPIENIMAESNAVESTLNLASGTIYFKVAITTFKFNKSLMQKHFNESYMESSKYSSAEFKGKINGQIDLTKAGTYPVIVQGDLNIHGVVKHYMVKAELNVKGEEITANCVFQVKLADHHIKIPRLVIKNITEAVQVTVSALYKPVSK